MKNDKVRARANRKAGDVTRLVSSAGKDGASIAPPSYGIDFLDSEMSTAAVVNGLAVATQLKQAPGSGRQILTANAARAESAGCLPSNLKAGIEHLSGLALDDVKEQYVMFCSVYSVPVSYCSGRRPSPRRSASRRPARRSAAARGGRASASAQSRRSPPRWRCAGASSTGGRRGRPAPRTRWAQTKKRSATRGSGIATGEPGWRGNDARRRRPLVQPGGDPRRVPARAGSARRARSSRG